MTLILRGGNVEMSDKTWNEREIYNCGSVNIKFSSHDFIANCIYIKDIHRYILFMDSEQFYYSFLSCPNTIYHTIILCLEYKLSP